jgi:hypothetical protein
LMRALTRQLSRAKLGSAFSVCIKCAYVALCHIPLSGSTESLT